MGKKQYAEIETDILVKAQAGDVDAFRVVYDFYFERVNHVVMRMIGEHWRKDAVQEVFIRVFKSLHQFNTQKKFFTWLYKITMNVCFDYLKKNRHISNNDTLESENLDEIAFCSIGNQVFDQDDELFGIVNELMKRLGPNQRAVFMMRDIDGFEISEISQIMKCTKSTVRAQLHFARKAVRNWLLEEYPEYKR